MDPGYQNTRSASPLPAANAYDHGSESTNVYGIGHDQGQGNWYTPPPSLPASIRPPEGWKSTLPADGSGHQWR